MVEIALLPSQIQQRIVGLFLQMEQTFRYLLLAGAGAVVQMAETVAVVENFATQADLQLGFPQQAQHSQFKWVQVVLPHQMEPHQLSLGVVLRAIKQTQVLAVVDGRA
jgi:hypothetical protein